MVFISPKNKAGYFLGGRALGGVSLDFHEVHHSQHLDRFHSDVRDTLLFQPEPCSDP